MRKSKYIDVEKMYDQLVISIDQKTPTIELLEILSDLCSHAIKVFNYKNYNKSHVLLKLINNYDKIKLESISSKNDIFAYYCSMIRKFITDYQKLTKIRKSKIENLSRIWKISLK